MMQLQNIDHLTLNQIYEHLGEPGVWASENTKDYIPYVVEPTCFNDYRLIKPQVILSSLSDGRNGRHHNPDKILNLDDIFGPLHYLAPEVLDGKMPSNASDVWSLAPSLWDGNIGAHFLFTGSIMAGGVPLLSREDVVETIRAKLGFGGTSVDDTDTIEEDVEYYQDAYEQSWGDANLQVDDDSGYLKEMPKMLRRMLKFSPKERVSAAHLVNDPWLLND
ncbi:hypothetical protein BJ875DRAFT_543981 [Amylocarpus encephaloides]|uniref:Protein kinase domain-containing protein n=1 Tax=Amylocarpus encephaloides TaxID=45428 RepID=A0A9P8C5L4_9HELO|nr:hypothetical protein BJ875DRAFT_543981 [Amylocarpus encephaloides]